MKRVVWPMASAGLFLLGLMVNIGCPASGSSGGGCMGAEIPPAPASCSPGSVDHGDGAGCVAGNPAASGGSSGNTTNIVSE